MHNKSTIDLLSIRIFNVFLCSSIIVLNDSIHVFDLHFHLIRECCTAYITYSCASGYLIYQLMYWLFVINHVNIDITFHHVKYGLGRLHSKYFYCSTMLLHFDLPFIYYLKIYPFSSFIVSNILTLLFQVIFFLNFLLTILTASNPCIVKL